MKKCETKIRDLTLITYYFKNGNIFIEEFYDNNKLLHNDKGPALIEYQGNNLYIEKYYFNGKLHNDKGPAIIRYHYARIIEENYYENNILHRVDGYAIIFYKKNLISPKSAYYFYGKKIKNKDVKIILQEIHKDDLHNYIMLNYY